MLTNVRYIFLTALRDKMFWVLLAGVLAAALIAHMLGATAPTHTREMTLTYSSNAARVMIILGLIIFVCSHLQNAFATHEIDVFLSRPITRTNLVISYWIGFANVALLHVLATIALLALQGVISWKGYVCWSVSLLLECWLAVAIALFASFTLKSGVASVLASLGIYVASRMIGFFVITTQSAFLFDSHALTLFLVYCIKALSAIFPRLDYFAKSDWLITGVGTMIEIKLFVAQALITIPLLVAASITDFKRKQF
jgi:ABC-type transport system involved in multi-copper enzyme maturation permease subunit